MQKQHGSAEAETNRWLGDDDRDRKKPFLSASQ